METQHVSEMADLKDVHQNEMSGMKTNYEDQITTLKENLAIVSSLVCFETQLLLR